MRGGRVRARVRACARATKIDKSVKCGMQNLHYKFNWDGQKVPKLQLFLLFPNFLFYIGDPGFS
jgi:hypothetical protein